VAKWPSEAPTTIPSSVVAWISLGVAVIALIVAIVYPRSGNRIAKKALAIAEREEEERKREQAARASLSTSLEPTNLMDRIDGGVARIQGNGGTARFALTITNDGARDAGRARVEVTIATPDNSSVLWTTASGHDLPGGRTLAARVGDESVLTYSLDRVARGVPETLHFRFPLEIPLSSVREYAIRGGVIAEGADGEAPIEYTLRVTQLSA
jgi:hypothetical protein